MRPRSSAAAHRLFDVVFLPWMRRRLHGPLVAGTLPVLDASTPILYAANHTSWWDGFLLRDLHRHMRPAAPLFTIMLEAELRRHPFFRWLGGIGLQPGVPSSLRSTLRTLRAERARSQRFAISYFPQGRIYPSTRRPLGFRSGIATFARTIAPVQIVPVGIHVEALNRAAPTAFLSVGPPWFVREERPDPQAIETAVAACLDDLHALIAEHGEDTPRLCSPAMPVSHATRSTLEPAIGPRPSQHAEPAHPPLDGFARP